MYGMRITMKLVVHGVVHHQVLRNVTEIHYGFEHGEGTRRIAFETDIHGTGLVYDTAPNASMYVKEFEVRQETEKAESF